MAQNDRIQRYSGADADQALDEAYGRIVPSEELTDRLDAENFREKCRRDFDAEVRRDRVENLTTEGLELGAAWSAGKLATWRTSSGFPIGQGVNWVLGAGAKAASIVMAFPLPKFEEMCDRPPASRRFLRSVVRSGKVLFQSQLSMMARGTTEDDK